MPWECREIMSIRREFIEKANHKLTSISQLCREYKISRKTAYKWIRRYNLEGLVGLNDRSKRPCQMPSKIRDESRERILSLKNQHPAWGAKKLRQVFINAGHVDMPSVGTFNRVLKEENKILPEESAKRTKYIRFEREAPNELWQMDFKGFFMLKQGACHPLTILDDCSRYSICLKACATENELVVRTSLEEAFELYGLPIAMTMDNGSPWKGYPGQRLSSLSVWLMRLGIRVTHSRPGHPQTQGKDERFHRTFKEEVLKYHNFQSLSDAQEHFNAWREIYNTLRPHEALEMACPAQRYERSARKYTGKPVEIEYLPEDEIRKVGNNGEIMFKGARCYVGGHLRGETVAFRKRNEGQWDIYFVNSRIFGFTLKV